MLAGCGAGVFAEDVAEIRGRGETTGGGDVFELAVRGAEQVGGGSDAAALQPVVGAHAGLAFEDEEQMCAAASGFLRHFVHGQRLSETVFHVFLGEGHGIGGAALMAAAGVPSDF